MNIFWKFSFFIAVPVLLTGCGPIPVISAMARCANHACDLTSDMRYEVPAKSIAVSKAEYELIQADFSFADFKDEREDKSNRIGNIRSIADGGIVIGEYLSKMPPAQKVRDMVKSAASARGILSTSKAQYEVSGTLKSLWKTFPGAPYVEIEFVVRRLADGNEILRKTVDGPISNVGLYKNPNSNNDGYFLHFKGRPDVVPDQGIFGEYSISVSEAIDRGFDALILALKKN